MCQNSPEEVLFRTVKWYRMSDADWIRTVFLPEEDFKTWALGFQPLI